MIGRLRNTDPTELRPIPPGGLAAAIAAGRRRRRRALEGVIGGAVAVSLALGLSGVLTSGSGRQVLRTAEQPTYPATSPSATRSPHPTTAASTRTASAATATRPTGSPARSTPARVVPAGPQISAAPGGPVAIGAVGTFSSTTGAIHSSYRGALVTWVAHVNATGGLGGRRLVLTILDDKGDPARHTSQVKQLLADPQTVALVADAGAVTSDASLARAAGVALVGATPVAADALGNSKGFLPSATSQRALTFGYLADAVTAGSRKLAVFRCIEAPECSKEHDLVVGQRYATDAGLSVVLDQTYSLTAADFTSECMDARSAGADTALVIGDGSSLIRLAASCHRAGVNVRYLMPSWQVRNEDGSLPDGLLSTQPVAPWFLASNAATADRGRLLAAAGVDRDPDSAQAWSAGELFGVVARHAGPALDRPGILAALEAVQAETTNGLTPPVTAGSPTRCWFPIVRQGGAWTAPRSTQTHCGDKP